MNKLKEILLGIIMGYIAFYIFVVVSGFVAAYIPISFSKITEGMSPEKAVIVIRAFNIFESFLSALPLAIAAYIFMLIFKLKASRLFLIISVTVFLGIQLYLLLGGLNIYSIISMAIPSIMLGFSLAAPNKQFKNGRLTAAL